MYTIVKLKVNPRSKVNEIHCHRRLWNNRYRYNIQNS